MHTFLPQIVQTSRQFAIALWSALAVALLTARPAAADELKEPVPADGPAISVTGVVLTPAGEPVSGATVVLRAKTGGMQYSQGMPHNRDVLARTLTNRTGRFVFEKIGLPPRLEELIDSLVAGRGGAELLAWANGWGLVWSDLQQLTTGNDIRLTLVRDAQVKGAVSDAAGNPIPNVRIEFYGATRSASRYDAFLGQPGDLNLSLSEFDLGGRTDERGQFSLPHLPVDYRLLLILKCPGYSRKIVCVDTGAQSGPRELTSEAPSQSIPILRAPLAIALGPGQLVTVKIVDHEDQPVTSGMVEAIDSERHWAGSAAVDPDGAARIVLSKPGRCRLRYASDPLSPTLNITTTAEITDEDNSPVVKIKLPEPRWLTGRVMDADTGAGVVGAYIRYSQAKAEGSDEWPPSSTAVSGPEGRFRLPVLPGSGKLGFQLSIRGYLTPNYRNLVNRKDKVPSTPVDIPESGDIPPVTLSLSHGLAISGTVRNPDGSPAAGAEVRGQTLLRTVMTHVDEQGGYELSGLSPHADAVLVAMSRRGAAQEIVPGEPNHPWNTTRRVTLNIDLQSGVTLTGRVLKDNQPQADVPMKMYRSAKPGGNQSRLFAELKTDSDGHFSVAGLAPGDQYFFEIETIDGSTDPNWRYQGPYIQTIAPTAEDEIKLPDVHLIGTGQTLRGIVVDPQGRPVVGVNVSASLPGGMSLSRRPGAPQPWTDTDSEGRFELASLPEKPIELMVYRRNPKETVIRRPSRVVAGLNQQDIRIVYDPSLNDEIEDLDAPHNSK